MKKHLVREHVQRRDFLRSVSLGLASVAAAGCGGEDTEEKPIEPPPPEAADYTNVVERYFDSEEDLENAAFIGRHYVRQEDISSSEAFEATERTRDIIDDADSDSDAVDELEASVHDDFVDVRVRAVDGWTLSRTEVDLCVLAHLLQHLDTTDAED